VFALRTHMLPFCCSIGKRIGRPASIRTVVCVRHNLLLASQHTLSPLDCAQEHRAAPSPDLRLRTVLVRAATAPLRIVGSLSMIIPLAWYCDKRMCNTALGAAKNSPATLQRPRRVPNKKASTDKCGALLPLMESNHRGWIQRPAHYHYAKRQERALG
jgi:hypothetical protein